MVERKHSSLFKMFPCCLDKFSDESTSMRDIVNSSHEVFANDLIFFLCEMARIRWTPPCCGIYSIHQSSPLTGDVRRLIRIWFGEKCDNYFKGNYDWHESKWEMYQNFCTDVTRTLRKVSSMDIPEAMSVQEVFFHVISVAKLSSIVYEGGDLDALTFAATRITEALEECNRKTQGKIFDLFSNYARVAVNRFTCESALISYAVNRPHEAFANDLILLMSHKRREACTPQCCQLSKMAPNSPLSQDIRKLLEKMYKKSECSYKVSCSRYENECKSRWEVFQDMSDSMKSEFESMSIKNIPAENWEKDSKLVNEFFNKVVHFAEISVMLHHRCTHATLSLGQLKLAEFLRVCNEVTNGRIFNLITNFASSIFKILACRNNAAASTGVVLRYKLSKSETAEE